MIKPSMLTAVVLLITLVLITGCATQPPLRGPLVSATLADGVYKGSYRDGLIKAVVRITISDRHIRQIDLLEYTTWLGAGAGRIIPSAIIMAQSTEVEAVSGATISSNVIMNAVQLAVEKAMK